MEKKNKISRRNWLQLGIGGALGTLSLKLIGCKNTPEDPASCRATPYQTMGPFHPNKDQADKDLDLTRFNGSQQAAQGEVIYVRGKVTDENCNPIPGAVVMIWQANNYGKYNHEYDIQEGNDDPNFQGWGQAVTDEKGAYGFKTIKPGAYPLMEGSTDYRTPHIHFKISRRGYHELITQMYFEGEELNEPDLLLSALSDTEKEQVVRKKQKGAEGIESDASLINFDVMLKKVEPAEGKDIGQYVGNYAVDIKVPEFETELLQFYGGQRDELTLAITRENGLLFAEMPIQPKCEIFRKSKDRYDYMAFEADIEFVRDENGRIKGLVFHRHYEFPELRAEKVS